MQILHLFTRSEWSNLENEYISDLTKYQKKFGCIVESLGFDGLFISRAFKLFMKSRGADFIHLHGISSLGILIPKGKMVLHLYKKDFENINLNKAKKMLKKAELIVIDSSQTFNSMMASKLNISEYKNKIFSTGRCVCTEKFSPLPNKQLSLNRNVGCIVDANNQKDICNLIDSTRYMPEEYLITFYLLEGSDDIESKINLYNDVSDNYGVASRISFSPISDLDKDINEIDLLVIRDGDTDVAIKALALNLPVISYSNSFEIDGFITVKSFTPKKIAQAIKNLIDKDNIVDLNSIELFYSWSSRIKKIIEFYEDSKVELTVFNEQK